MFANLLALFLQCMGYGSQQTTRPWDNTTPRGDNAHLGNRSSEPGNTSSVGGQVMAIVIIDTDVDERAQIEEALGHLVTTAKRLPSHFVARRAELHDTMNALLDQWEACA